jgi:hypothetical protein
MSFNDVPPADDSTWLRFLNSSDDLCASSVHLDKLPDELLAGPPSEKYALFAVGARTGEHKQKLTKVHVMYAQSGPQLDCVVQILVQRRLKSGIKSVRVASPYSIAPIACGLSHAFFAALSFLKLTPGATVYSLALHVCMSVSRFCARNVRSKEASPISVLMDSASTRNLTCIAGETQKLILCVTISLLSSTGDFLGATEYDSKRVDGARLLHIFRKRLGDKAKTGGNKSVTSYVLQDDERDPTLTLMLKCARVPAFILV